MALKVVSEKPNLPQPSAASLPAVAAWQGALVVTLFRFFRDLAARANLAAPKDGTERMEAPLPLAQFTVATRPAASSWAGALIYVSDGGSGAIIQASNGTSWVNLG
jgi:hypothetical protein